MLKSTVTRIMALTLGVSAFVFSAQGAELILKQQTGLVVPSTRGEANTAHFGWDFFEDPETYSSAVLADETPDINSEGAPAGVKFETTNGQLHRASSGNFYSGAAPTAVVAEKVTVATGTVPETSGKTTIIVQMITGAGPGGAPSNFYSAWLFGEINGVKPVEVVQSTNKNGFGQVWAKWELPGTEASYEFTIGSVSGQHMSFDKIEIDTWFSLDGASHPDSMILAQPANFTLNKESNHAVPTTRGAANTTHFGWDIFEDPATYSSAVLADETPDIISATTPAGVKFESLHGNLNRASTGNYYSGSSTATAVIDEKVTVVTNGTPGPMGKTTIIAQLVGTGMFPSTWTFGEINGVAPEVVSGGNGLNRGQVWVKWEIEGNEETYEFTIGSVAHPSFGQAHMSFDKIEIDTYFDIEEGSHPDSMILSEPAAIAHIMDQASGPVEPSSRGTRDTTYFGWDGFGAPGPAALIDDNTPDIGSDPTGLARFRTTNGEIHQLGGGGNLYLLSFIPEVDLTLAEEITVPTDGEVGDAGVTTIILQIASAGGGMGGAFAGPIYVSDINGVAPTVVQASSSTSAQFWAKWVIPGNQPTYTIQIDGVPNQQHYSFDKVVVDTKYSRYEGVGDTMKGQTVEITTESLADAVRGEFYSVQLEAEGGVLPHTWSLADESSLPAGLTLSSSGLISGTPTALGSTTFTVVAREGDDYEDEKTYELAVVSGLFIVTESLPTGVVGLSYAAPLAAADGLEPYTWEIIDGTLPAGLNLTGGVITGTPTAATAEDGVSITVQVTDGESSTVAQVFTLRVSPTLLAPAIEPLNFPPTVVGVLYEHAVAALNYPSSHTITGLPRGLSYNKTTGVISGRPLVAGVFNVQVKATNKAGSSPITSGPLVVQALPGLQTGAFAGLVDRDAGVNGDLGSLLTLNTTSTGAFTVKIKTGAKTVSAKGFLNALAPQVQATVGGVALTLTLDGFTGLVTGTHGAAVVNGWRTAWDKNFNPATSREGYYSAALDITSSDSGDDAIPQGSGFATFTVSTTGVVKAKGKTADGQNVTVSGVLGAQGQLAVYVPLYKNTGSLLGPWEITEDSGGNFAENTVTGDLTWKKPARPGRDYAAGFGPVDVVAEGGYLGVIPAKGRVVLGLPEAGSVDLEFAEGGIAESATTANVEDIEWKDTHVAVMPVAGNAAKVSLKANKGTGAINGAFTLEEPAPNALTRKNVKFFGQVVRLADGETKAVGYFLLPQIPSGGQTPKNSPILSGAVFLVQPESL